MPLSVGLLRARASQPRGVRCGQKSARSSPSSSSSSAIDAACRAPRAVYCTVTTSVDVAPLATSTPRPRSGRRATAGARPAPGTASPPPARRCSARRRAAAAPLPKVGRLTRSPGDVKSTCSIRSRTCSSSSVTRGPPAAVDVEGEVDVHHVARSPASGLHDRPAAAPAGSARRSGRAPVLVCRMSGLAVDRHARGRHQPLHLHARLRLAGRHRERSSRRPGRCRPSSPPAGR